MKTISLVRVISIVLLVLLAPGCVTERSPVTGERRMYAFTWDQEVQLGSQTDQQMAEQLGIYEDEELQQYVQRIGQQVLQHSDMRGAGTPEMYLVTPFTFRVMNSPVVNAFALPGGYIYVTRGLLAHCQNEAQLAVVLGHEIAHVAARHASRQVLRAQAGQLGLFAGAILGGQVFEQPALAGNILEIGGAAFQLVLTRYSRGAEREADELGVRYASHAGYQTEEGAGFFQVLQRIGEREGRMLPSWQSTHPDPGEREINVINLAREHTAPDAILRVGQESLLSRLEGMVIGEDPREGFVREHVFYHPELAFQFPVPSGWNVRNERAAVLLLQPDRQAAVIFQISPELSAGEAAAKLRNVDGLRIQSSRPIQVNGLPAQEVLGTARTDRGELGVLILFIEHAGRVYNFMGYAPAPQFSRFRPELVRTMNGFAPLIDPAILAAEPARLAIVRAPRRGPFSEFLPDELPVGLTAYDLAIMNHVRLDELIEEGTLLKLPRW
jgi:predicted Zn-dependent protease